MKRLCVYAVVVILILVFIVSCTQTVEEKIDKASNFSVETIEKVWVSPTDFAFWYAFRFRDGNLVCYGVVDGGIYCERGE